MDSSRHIAERWESGRDGLRIPPTPEGTISRLRGAEEIFCWEVAALIPSSPSNASFGSDLFSPLHVSMSPDQRKGTAAAQTGGRRCQTSGRCGGAGVALARLCGAFKVLGLAVLR